MLDTSNLSVFCKGIADALRKKKGTTNEIEYKKFDEEIESIDTNKGLIDMLEGRTNYYAALSYTSLTEIPDFEPNPKVINYESFLQDSMSLTSFPNFIDFSKISRVSKICYDCTSLKGDVIVDFSKVTSLNECFGWCTKVENIEFTNGTPETTNAVGTMAHCRALTSVKGLDFTKITTSDNLKNVLLDCPKLRTIEFFKDECITVSFGIENSPLLTEQSKVNIINALAIVSTSQTLTLNNENTLTNEQIETINSKGWNLAYVN